MLNDFDKAGQLELIEFSLRREIEPGHIVDGLYAVNVAKVREVIRMPKINQLASKVNGIAGVFELRNVVIPVVDLTKVFGDAKSLSGTKHQIIITEFSQKRAGFIVNETTRIRRLGWDSVLPPPVDSSSFISGMVLLKPEEFLFILDLEKILLKIEAIAGGDNPQDMNGFSIDHNAGNREKPRNGKSILVVDDSSLMLSHMTKILHLEGYQVFFARNGQEALEVVANIETGKGAQRPTIDAVVTDIEMPLVDGMQLTQALRKMPNFVDTPIILHSSLDGLASKELAAKAGATTYVVKNNIADLIHTLEHYVLMQKASDL